jgi:hypothetical protein
MFDERSDEFLDRCAGEERTPDADAEGVVLLATFLRRVRKVANP